MTNASLTIWTIGHSNRSIEEFIDLLRENQIEILVDVRHFPGSRSFPHFNKPQLARALSKAGIRYEHLVDLGGRRRVQRDSHNTLWRNASFRGYADYMETPPFRDAFDRLLEIARTGRAAIMCSEVLWWRCHRSMIADALKARGVRVLHIMIVDKVQEHPYTSAARLVNGRLSYEGPATAVDPHEQETKPMKQDFKVGDLVEWNSEAGRVRGTIKKRVTSEIPFKGYTVHASKDEPQYLIKSIKTDHLAMHKGTALKKIRKTAEGKK
ncbi:MAG TPA: HVA1 family protein [Tepidisphaeraceae bacterium]|jgi:uncharacterized protein (DUF488 family)|nr:HVA1 family protein [Tepidisphaeraceae bacterium]